MNKIKVIKRDDVGVKSQPTNRKAVQRPKKVRSVESTIQAWITERRDDEEAEHISRKSKFAAWKPDTKHAEAA
jgi:hypothetical protein